MDLAQGPAANNAGSRNIRLREAHRVEDFQAGHIRRRALHPDGAVAGNQLCSDS
jgi:hypothetical protein